MGYGFVCVPWREVVDVKKISTVPSQSGSLTYTGSALAPTWQNFDAAALTVGGVTSATDAGTYTATVTPNKGYAWEDGSTGAKNVTWTIERAVISSVPSQSGSLSYTGSVLTPTWSNYDSSKMTIGGTTSATDAGTHTATFTPKPNYQWSGGSTEAKSVTWTISAAGLSVPYQKGSLAYTGNSQTPAWYNYDSGKMTLGGTYSGTNAGSYTATFTPRPGYQWSDGTTTAKSVTWTIAKAEISVPSQKGSLTYSGSSQSPSWNNYDSGKMTIGGTTSGTNAGSYSASFTPKPNYQWPGGSTSAKSVTWSIGKAAGSLSLNKSSLTLNVSSLTGTISVTRSGSGTISATSSKTSVATVSVSGTTVTVTAKAKGSATITVSVASDSNYTAPTSKTCSVTVNMPSTTLGDNTPAEIQAAARAGTAPNYWSVGDKIGIKIDGTFGGLTVDGTYYAVIIGFNHNSSIEGSNSIHFQFGKNSSGKDIAFVQNYSSVYTGFCMEKTSDNNTGGWKSSYMIETICPAFLSAMPTAWQNVIASCTKYSDNTGGSNIISSNVTSTSDKVWLLSEFEVFGTITYANPAEKNYQKQYDYYKNGNSKIRSKHSSTDSNCDWWLRSISSVETYFSIVNEFGHALAFTVSSSRGFSPCFKVA